MELSKRLKFIADKIDKCKSIADIGTDHGYLPIYAVKNNICEKAIASDINKSPVKKARLNVSCEKLSDKIDVRLGPGLTPILKGEVNGVVIAGMGGNLIRDILKAEKKKVEGYDFLILQPAQNPEVLREYLYTHHYQIIDEDVCFDDNIFYELIKVKVGDSNFLDVDPIFYEFSPVLLESSNPEVDDYLLFKKNKYEKIIGFIKDNTESAIKRKNDINDKLKLINKFIEERKK